MRTINKTLTALVFTMFVLPAFADTAPDMGGTPRLAIGGGHVRQCGVIFGCS
jgi:hypothetical protein